MKNLGAVIDAKDITTKEYVDAGDSELDRIKLEESDFEEFSNEEILEMWNMAFTE